LVRRLFETSHAVQAPPPTPEGGLPEWYHVVPAGEFRGRDGRGPYRLLTPGDVVEAFAAWGGDLCVDYEHQTLTAAQKAGPVPAAGWVKALEAREDGIWARIEWTETAAAALRAKEYRYLSPVFDYMGATGEVRVLKMVALTNIPNLHLQAAASRQGDAMNELLERLCYMLNLPLTTTAEEMAAQLDKLKTMLADAQATATASAELAKAVGLAADAPIATVAQSIQAKLTSLATPDPAQYVPKAQYDQVAHSLAELQGTTQAAETVRLVEEAMSAGKVPPALKAWATEYATRDPEGFRHYAESAPVITGTAHSNLGQGSGADTQTLNPEEETVSHALGLSADAYLAAKKEVD
jgi:phage I-like protein